MYHWIEITINVAFSACLFINAALFLPQILKIVRQQNSKGLAITTFAGFNIIQLFAVLYGVAHQDYILIIGNLLAFLTCGVVTILIIWHSYLKQLFSADYR